MITEAEIDPIKEAVADYGPGTNTSEQTIMFFGAVKHGMISFMERINAEARECDDKELNPESILKAIEDGTESAFRGIFYWSGLLHGSAVTALIDKIAESIGDAASNSFDRDDITEVVGQKVGAACDYVAGEMVAVIGEANGTKTSEQDQP